MNEHGAFAAVAVGASSGGMHAIRALVSDLPADLCLAVIVVQHISPSSDGSWASLLESQCAIAVKEVDEKESIRPRQVYLAPANYHLLVETDRTFTLTVDEPVNYARPSIDVLFETAAEAFGPQLIGVVMTGANADGAKGLRHIKERGGLTVVQCPDTAQAPQMPRAAIAEAVPHHILSIEDIRDRLLAIHHHQQKHAL